MMRRHDSISIVLTAISVCICPLTLHAQQAAAPHDSLRLADLQTRAVQHDPRTRQLDLLSSQSALRMQDIDASRLPTIGANAQAQYQSQVVTLPLQLPNGLSFPVPPHDTYDAHVGAQQPIYDPTVSARRGVERAQLAASEAGVRTSTFALRQNVNDAYFSALLQQAQRAEQESAITDLEARRKVAASRVAQGTALPSETDMLDAELLRRRQAVAQLAASRDAALVVLSDLTGQQITSADALVLPNLSADVARARENIDTVHARSEYEQFARNRDVLAQQQSSLGAADLPRVSAFGRAGYGRPGLNPLAQEFSNYWLAGVQVEWTPWNWGTTRRDREVLALQRQIVATNETAFRQSVQRAIAHDVASIDQLAQTLVDDDTIVTLREKILRETGFRFSEGVVTSAEYVDRETDLLDARLSRAMHRVQLAQARANFLTSLGLEVH
jgi:outer membrane protein TolC